MGFAHSEHCSRRSHMRQQRHPAIMKLTFLVLFFCSLLPAQVNTATILGAVTDASGGAVRGASLVSTQNTELGVVIGEQQVRNLPLNGRNFAQLIALEPGAVVSGGAVYFNGLSRDNVNITVDGTDAANPDRPATGDFGGQTQ